jgi:phosphonate transport system substrate-binding protein
VPKFLEKHLMEQCVAGHQFFLCRKFISQQFLLKAALLTTVSLVGCSRNNREVGTEDRPFQIAFIPTDDTQQILSGAETLSKYLETKISQKLYGKDTGFHIKATVPQSYSVVIEAISTKRVDLASLDTFSYSLLKDRNYPAEAIVSTLRFGNQKTYRGQILVRADSGLKKIEDLNGKKFAFVDPSSPAGYLLPMALFKEKGVKLGEQVFANRHDNVVTMIYQKQVDAGATYYSPPTETEKDGKKVVEINDARAKVKTQFPDVESKIKILDFTAEIPNGPWVLRTNIFQDEKKNLALKEALQEALIAYGSSPDGQVVLKSLHNISGLEKSEDKDFDNIRAFFKKSEMDLKGLVK